MQNDGPPETWVGEEVIVHSSSRAEFLAVLGGADEIFMPWSSILWMKLAGEEAKFYRE
jgi:hypothetical protein